MLPVNREPASMAQRKESFEDIADALKSLDSSLTGGAVEKQWKNLKVFSLVVILKWG